MVFDDSLVYCTLSGVVRLESMQKKQHDQGKHCGKSTEECLKSAENNNKKTREIAD